MSFVTRYQRGVQLRGQTEMCFQYPTDCAPGESYDPVTTCCYLENGGDEGGGDEIEGGCPWWNPFCDTPTPTTPPGTTEALCPPGWVCQTAEVHQQQIDDAKTAKYVWAGAAAAAGLLGGIAIGGMLAR